MAQWVTRLRTDDGASIQIKWREDGRWQTETFTDAQLASEFRIAVENAGNRWPAGWLKHEGWAPRETPPPTMTFADVAVGTGGYFDVQDRRVLRGKVKRYTLHGYRRIYEITLVDTFGHLTFDEIDSDDIADWIDQQLEAGAAPKSIRNRHGVLFSIMKHGKLKMRLRNDNPCELSELPESGAARSETRQIRFFQPKEWEIFRGCVDADFQLPLDFDLATGLRWGELSALRVGDITFSGKKKKFQANVHVVRAWSRRAPDDPAEINHREGETTRWVLGPPKSRRSRWVAVTGDVARRLQSELSGRGEDEYVFSTVQGCPWCYPDFHTRRWTPAKRRAVEAGLIKKITPHMLRHTTVDGPSRQASPSR